MKEKYAVCSLSLANMRKKPDDRSELVSQILFGETIELIQKYSDNWYYIKSSFDGYEGFVDPKQIYFITEEEHKSLSKPNAFAMENAYAANAGENFIPLTIGASLPNFDGLSFKMPFGKMQFAHQIIDLDTVQCNGPMVEKIAKKYMQAPYLWGGRSPFGIDCSGLTQVVYKMLGVSLPRDSNKQARKGHTVAFVESSMSGDLAFFMKESNRIVHVGIITSEQKIIHASGKVRIDLIDNHGIYNEELGKYTHKLRVIKRYL